MMTIEEFIINYREAFGENTELPVAFWYSDELLSEPQILQGCLFKYFIKVRKGICLSLKEEAISCPGGKLYTGFSEMAEYIPPFVSLKEKYKQTPESVVCMIDKLHLQLTGKKYLNVARIDKLSGFDVAEGIIFFPTPDVLAGLTTWAFYDNDADDAVATIFGSGCSVMISAPIHENRINGKRTFLGGFDPSVRPYLKANELIFTIPIIRFREMLATLRQSCLYNTAAWSKVQKRIGSSQKRLL